MKLSLATSIAILAALAAATPLGERLALNKRAVFGATTYNAIQISGGSAGNAQEEALAVLDKLPSDLASAESDDLDFLNSVNQVANDAESEAFNPAIDAASGDEADALQRGKIKNKVLKLQATVLKLQAQQAQGQDVADKLATEQKKLDNNIAQDQAEAGQPSTSLSFDADIPE